MTRDVHLVEGGLAIPIKLLPMCDYRIAYTCIYMRVCFIVKWIQRLYNDN